MATFGKDVGVFQQIAGGNLQALRDLVASTTRLVQQPMPSTEATILGNIGSQGQSGASTPVTTIEKSL
jgi:hypothetical protein